MCCDCGFKLLGLFGEGPADRRERLRQLLADLGQLIYYIVLFEVIFSFYL